LGTERIIAVSDAGPLIHLSEIGLLSTLEVFESIHIPEAVCCEVAKHRGDVSLKEILHFDNIKDHTLDETDVARFIKENNLEKLDNGERECLYLCINRNITLLLTDDLAVREATKDMNLKPVGSLGIIIRAYRMEKISLAEAEQYISDLYEVSSLFITKAITELAIEQLHNYTGLK
jgi:predicted nucleic acid-binding protein